MRALCLPKRDCRVKPGNDKGKALPLREIAKTSPAMTTPYAWLAAVLPSAACAAASRAIGTRKGEHET
jgi:hypothetical protein